MKFRVGVSVKGVRVQGVRVAISFRIGFRICRAGIRLTVRVIGLWIGDRDRLRGLG